MLYKLKLQSFKNDIEYKRELKRRLQRSQGGLVQANLETKRRNTKFSSKSSVGLDKDENSQDKKIKSYEESFNRELIEPCNCNEKYHRICIREKITKNMTTVCEKCQFQYVVAYTECYALFNSKRRNYMGYMLW